MQLQSLLDENKRKWKPQCFGDASCSSHFSPKEGLVVYGVCVCARVRAEWAVWRIVYLTWPHDDIKENVALDTQLPLLLGDIPWCPESPLKSESQISMVWTGASHDPHLSCDEVLLWVPWAVKNEACSVVFCEDASLARFSVRWSSWH